MKSESYEFIGEKDEAVSRLIASLPRVEAPSNFEMRVRARIASGRTAGPSWLTPLVRVAAPAALLIAIGGYFGYYALYRNTPSPTSDIVVAPASKIVPPQAQPTAVNEIAVVPNVATEPPAPSRSNEFERQPSSSSRGTSEVPGGGTLESALKQPKHISQPGQANRSLQGLNPSEGGPGLSPKDVLETIGITASFSSTEWRVNSVRPNSLAGKSGVKAGDIIEALNDQPLTEKTVLGRTVTGSSIRVRRDQRSIKIDLKP